MAVTSTDGGGLYATAHEEPDRRYELGEASDSPHRAGWVPDEDRSQPGQPVRMNGTHLPAFAAVPAPPASSRPLSQEPPWEDPPFNLYFPTIMGNLTVLDDGSGNNLYGQITCRQLNAAIVTTGIVPSGDQSGITDTAAINAAVAALTSGGTLLLGPGDFYITSLTIPAQIVPGQQGGPGVSVQGSGWATILHVVGGGTGIYYHRTDSYGGSVGVPSKGTGFLRDFTVDGTLATAGAIGVDVGDGWGYDINLMIVNFAAAGCIGFHQNDAVFWSEKGRYRLHLVNNDTAAVIDTTNATPDVSHEYNEFEFYIFALATGSGAPRNQNGVVLASGVNVAGCSIKMRGNMGATTAATAGAFAFTATNASPCVFTAATTAFTSGTPVVLSGASLPAGFSAATLYWVVNPGVAGAGTFELAATVSGAAIASTSTGSGTVTTAFAALTVAGSNPVNSNFSQIFASHIMMKVERRGTGTGADPTAIVLGSSGNAIQECEGIIAHSLTSSVLNGGEFTFRGMIQGDSNLNVPVTPAVPASGTARKNLGCDASVCIPSGTTITGIAVGSVTTGLTSGVFFVPAGGTITLSYSGATPTWAWVPACQSQY